MSLTQAHSAALTTWLARAAMRQHDRTNIAKSDEFIGVPSDPRPRLGCATCPDTIMWRRTAGTSSPISGSPCSSPCCCGSSRVHRSRSTSRSRRSRRWSECPADDEDRLIWAFETSQALIAAAVCRGVVPSVERTRDQHADHRTLSIAEQRQIVALSEQPLDLPPRVRDVVDAMARDAPAPGQLRALRCSPLVSAEPLPERDRKTDGA